MAAHSSAVSRQGLSLHPAFLRVKMACSATSGPNHPEDRAPEMHNAAPDLSPPTLAPRKGLVPAWQGLKGAARAIGLGLPTDFPMCYKTWLSNRLPPSPVHQGQAEQKNGKKAGRPSVPRVCSGQSTTRCTTQPAAPSNCQSMHEIDYSLQASSNEYSSGAGRAGRQARQAARRQVRREGHT